MLPHSGNSFEHFFRCEDYRREPLVRYGRRRTDGKIGTLRELEIDLEFVRFDSIYGTRSREDANGQNGKYPGGYFT